MNKHKFGEWRQSQKRPDAIVSDLDAGHDQDESSIKHHGGHLVAESVAPENRPLISAAPDLLEACEMVLKWALSATGMVHFDNHHFDKVSKAVRKAKEIE